MPRYNSKTKDTRTLSFQDSIRNGRVVPILSGEMLFDLAIGSHVNFVEHYRNQVRYSGTAASDLVEMVKFHKHRPRLEPMTNQELQFDYLNHIKNHIYDIAVTQGATEDQLEEADAQWDLQSVSEFADGLGLPALTDTTDPLLTLANLPFKTILTTSPFTFMEAALIRAKKKPRTELCRWNEDLFNSVSSAIDPRYEPSVQEPLVYHLLGLDSHKESLVLTDVDYLDYLVNVCQAQGNDAIDLIPALVRKALSDDLVVLGFTLNSWSFRVLYAGFINPNARHKDRGVCNVVLSDRPQEHSYLEDYVQREIKFRVFWGDIHDYAERLRQT